MFLLSGGMIIVHIGCYIPCCRTGSWSVAWRFVCCGFCVVLLCVWPCFLGFRLCVSSRLFCIAMFLYYQRFWLLVWCCLRLCLGVIRPFVCILMFPILSPLPPVFFVSCHYLFLSCLPQRAEFFWGRAECCWFGSGGVVVGRSSGIMSSMVWLSGVCVVWLKWFCCPWFAYCSNFLTLQIRSKSCPPVNGFQLGVFCFSCAVVCLQACSIMPPMEFCWKVVTHIVHFHSFSVRVVWRFVFVREFPRWCSFL